MMRKLMNILDVEGTTLPGPGWQPIDTIPHDGTPEDRAECGLWHGPVLLFIPDQHGGIMLVAQCDSDDWIVGDENRAFSPIDGKQPTHWMPLPPKPE